MAFSTYSDLVSAIGAWTHRADLVSVIPDFIRLAESRLQNDLDVRQLGQLATLTTTSGSNLVALPSDFNQMRCLSVNVGGVVQVLDNMRPEILIQRYGSATSSTPKNYSMVGGNLMLGPTPSGVQSLSLEYVATIAALSVSNPTNTVLSAYPEAYLHCCLIFAGQYLRDAEFVAGMEQLYATDVERINNQNWAQQATMSMKTV